MELSLTFFATGGIIIFYNIWRARRLKMYTTLTKSLASEYDITDLDNTGQTSYTNCTSHKWVIDNLGRKKHGKFGTMFQERLFDNTLSTFMSLAFILGCGAMIFGILLIRSIEVAGMSLFVIFVGVMVVLGPGDAKVSEDLLLELSNYNVQDLCKEDYVYVELAIESVRRWIIIAIGIGASIVIISPWAENIPILVAGIIATITTYLIWNPALFLSEISFPLAIAYLSIILPLMFYTLTLLFRRVRSRDEEQNGQSIQW
ncbi:MAG: hypothetical protein ACFFF4_06540 [Candidatus Thorarchaeota archaeon]